MEREEWFFIYSVIFLIAASFLMGPLIVDNVERAVLLEGVVVKNISSLLFRDLLLLAVFFAAGFPLASVVFEPYNMPERFFTSVAVSSVFTGLMIFFGSLGGQGFRYFMFDSYTLFLPLAALGLTGLLFRRISGGDSDD